MQLARQPGYPIPLIFALGGCNILHWRLLSANNAVICMALGLSYVWNFCLSSVQFYCMPDCRDVVCLVLSLLYV